MARDAKGRWLPGESANPKGAVPGYTWQAKLRRELAGDVPKIARRMVELAMEGDTAAAELIMKRTILAIREEPLSLPWGDGDSVEARAEAVLQATARGALTTEQCGRLMLALKTAADLSTLVEMRAELDELREKIR